jgi:hypothetical protein
MQAWMPELHDFGFTGWKPAAHQGRLQQVAAHVLTVRGYHAVKVHLRIEVTCGSLAEGPLLACHVGNLAVATDRCTSIQTWLPSGRGESFMFSDLHNDTSVLQSGCRLWSLVVLAKGCSRSLHARRNTRLKAPVHVVMSRVAGCAGRTHVRPWRRSPSVDAVCGTR